MMKHDHEEFYEMGKDDYFVIENSCLTAGEFQLYNSFMNRIVGPKKLNALIHLNIMLLKTPSPIGCDQLGNRIEAQ